MNEVDGDPAAQRRGGGCSGVSAGLRRASARGRGVAGEEGGAKGCSTAALPPPLYIGPLGGRRPQEMGSQGGAAATRGGRGCLAPQGKWGAPHPRVSNPRRRGEAHGGRPSTLRAGCPPTSAHGALRDRWPHPVDPRDPFGGPGTIPVTPETFPVAET